MRVRLGGAGGPRESSPGDGARTTPLHARVRSRAEGAASADALEARAPGPGAQDLAAAPSSVDPGGKRSAPARGSSLLSALPSLAGRIGVGVAVTGVILGGLIGSPEARTSRGAEAPFTVTAPAGREVSEGARMFSDALRAIAPVRVERAEVLDAIGHVSFSVTVEDGCRCDAGASKVEIAPGTRVTAELTRRGLEIGAEPAMRWVLDWAPDVEISHLTYEFTTGRFVASASGFGPDFLYTNAVIDRANTHLMALVPAEMQRPGYDPFGDPHLEANLQRIVDATKRAFEPGLSTPSTSDLALLAAPAITFDVVVPEERSVRLPGTKHTAFIAADTRAWVSVSGAGAITDPRLARLELRFSKPVEISSGTERSNGVARMDLNGIALYPGGEVTLDYDLGLEQAIDGVRALIALAAILSEPRAVGSVGRLDPVRMESLRAEVQTKVDGDLEPALIQFVRDHDGAIRGVSLERLLGIE